jgi:hypothetical protein
MIAARVVTSLAAGCVLWCGWGASEALAQKGTGDATGVARQAVKPEVVSLTGKITEVQSAPCELSTGWGAIGTHVLLKADEGKTFNIHLGPQAEVADVAERLKVGETLVVSAFRTEKMWEGHYVAQSLKVGDEMIELRDVALRPVWAGGRAAARGRRGYRPCAGYTYAQGRGPGRGSTWICPRWGGPPQGAGPGWRATGRGPGHGFGPRFGRGPCGGRGAGLAPGRGQGRGPGFGRTAG